MKARHTLIIALLLLAPTSIAVADCGKDHEHHAASHQMMQLPDMAGDGEGKEVKVLMDEPHLKLATVALRRGTVLPSHSTPVPATIQVLEGNGVIHVAGEAVTVTAGSVVVLAAGQEHDVVPEKDGDMLLLVHYLRSGGGEGCSEAECHHCDHHGGKHDDKHDDDHHTH